MPSRTPGTECDMPERMALCGPGCLGPAVRLCRSVSSFALLARFSAPVSCAHRCIPPGPSAHQVALAFVTIAWLGSMSEEYSN